MELKYKPTVTSPYGMRTDPFSTNKKPDGEEKKKSFHRGRDIGSPFREGKGKGQIGPPVYAPFDGVVVEIAENDTICC